MRNKYAGLCYRCGEAVLKNKGLFERFKGDMGWRVQHVKCAPSVGRYQTTGANPSLTVTRKEQ